MDLLEYPKLPHLLKRLNSKDYNKFNTFMWNGSHIKSVVRYLHKMRTIDDTLFDPLERIETSRDSTRFPRMVLSFIDNLQKCFRLPEPNSFAAHYKANELIMSFLDFLLDIVEEIFKGNGNLLDSIEDEIEDLQMKLKFLITVLGDAPFRRTNAGETKNVLEQLEAFAKEVGDYLYLYFFTDESMQSRIDLPLFQLLKKFELVEAKIKDHCVVFTKLPSFELSDKAIESLFIVDSLINDLEDMMNRDHEFIAEVSGDIKALKEELILATKILRGVKGQHYLPEVATKVRDVAYEAEYLINSLVVGDVPLWYLNLRLPNIIEKIKVVVIGLQEIKKTNYGDRYFISSFQVGDIPVWYFTPRHHQAKDVDVDTHTTKPEKIKEKRYTSSLSNKNVHGDEMCLSTSKEVRSTNEIIVGFQKEALKIAEQLVSGPKQQRVILISGMPGLGKTTLANKLFNDPAVSQHFDDCAWCVATQTHHTKKMLIDILRFVGDQDHDNMWSEDAETLGEEIHKTLIGRRYLVVIDDVWNIDVLYEIRRYLPQGPGSRILITSRRKDVAPHDGIVHELPFLSHEQCWDLLQQKVYQNREQKCPKELVDIGKQIAAHCKGLPLAVVVIAAVLENTNGEKKLWSEVAETLNSQISKNPDIYRNILEISYKHLPDHLRPCFLYFGAFQGDREIPVRKLVSLWISEGFIPKEENKNLTSVAEEYLKDLLSRNLVRISKRRTNHGVKTCLTHDLMRYFCLRKAKEENFLNVIDDQFSIYEHHQRLHISSKLNYADSRHVGPHIRSWFGHLSNVSFICSRTKLLRVLDSSAVEYPEDSKMQGLDLTGIEQLFHLRYMDIRINADTTLESIGCLQNLECLHLHSSQSQPLKIPNSLLNLERLRHLQIKAHSVFDESCHNRVAQDSNFQMESLERLSNIHIIHENDEKILRCLPNLCSLKCSTKPLWDSSEMRYRYPALGDLTQLKSLNITYLGSEFKFKEAINFPSNIEKLTLHEFKLSRGEISMIGRLEKLEVLKLQYATFDGKEWKTNDDEFQKLKFLKLEALRIHRWNTSSDHFPELRQLIIQKCWKLKRLPTSLQDISSLQIINISFCSNGFAESAKRLQQQLFEMGNEEPEIKVSGHTR